MANADTYAALVLQDSPRAYWKMNEPSGLPQDSSGNGNHMTGISGGAMAADQFQQPGPGGSLGMFFNNQSVSRTRVSTATANITWEAWVRVLVPAFSGSVGLFVNGSYASDRGWTARVNGTIDPSTFQARVSATLLTAGSLIVVGTWYHLVVVRETTVWKYYRDGVVDLANAGTTTPTAVNGGDLSVIGDTSSDAIYSNVAYYETALPESTIFAHYRAMTQTPSADLRSAPPRGWGAA